MTRTTYCVPWCACVHWDIDIAGRDIAGWVKRMFGEQMHKLIWVRNLSRPRNQVRSPKTAWKCWWLMHSLLQCPKTFYSLTSYRANWPCCMDGRGVNLQWPHNLIMTDLSMFQMHRDTRCISMYCILFLLYCYFFINEYKHSDRSDPMSSGNEVLWSNWGSSQALELRFCGFILNTAALTKETHKRWQTKHLNVKSWHG